MNGLEMKHVTHDLLKLNPNSLNSFRTKKRKLVAGAQLNYAL